MHQIRVSEAIAGYRLTKSVMTEGGRVLLPAGAQLTQLYLQLLISNGIETIWVAEVKKAAAKPDELVSAETRNDLASEMGKIMADLTNSFVEAPRGLHLPTLPLKTQGLKRVVDRVVHEILATPKAVVTLQELRQTDEYTMMHSIEVCILTTLLGTAAGMGRAELSELSLAALVHDIGKTGVPLSILNKPGRLTDEEMAVMASHTTLGWTILRAQPDMSEEQALVAVQHHERIGGGGYPLGLSGEKIHRYSRLCTVADVYDALTADRVYKKGYSPAEALATMTGPMSGVFDPHLLTLFIDIVAPFPIGAQVEMTDGRRGVVTAVDRKKVDRPRVMVTQDRAGRALAQPYEMELVEEPSVQLIWPGAVARESALANAAD